VPSVTSHYLRIQEQQAGRYFDVSTTSGEGSRVYGGGYAPVDNQEFAVMPVAGDANLFFIAALHRGGLLWSTVGAKHPLYMDEGTIPHTDSALSQFQIVSNEAAGCNPPDIPSPFHITQKYWGNVLDVSNTRRERNMVYVGNNVGGANQLFEFVEGREFPNPMPVEVVGATPGAIGDVPRMTDFSSTPSLESTSVTIGVRALPFVYVLGDGGLPYQVQNTPYYSLTREQLWKRGPIQEKPRGVALTQTYSVETGVAASTSLQVERTLSFATKINGGLEFSNSDLKATLGVSLEQQLQVHTTLTDTFSHDTTTTESRSLSFGADQHIRWTSWQQFDRFTLRRMDGTMVMQWDVAFGTDAVIDAIAE
ncbi:MAG TPA: hypothetical protein VMG12_29680, partial [Polyangiaceae bacterium]|nr:hypothetical protein [Polyangiaceae bacterium]